LFRTCSLQRKKCPGAPGVANPLLQHHERAVSPGESCIQGILSVKQTGARTLNKSSGTFVQRGYALF
jgi:hypothetical protein